MGNFCCANESPCGSAEERSSLLKDESKMAAPTGEPVVGGTCGPDAGDDMRKTHDEAGKKVEEKAEAVQIKQSPEKGESQANNTQENGPVKKENTQKTMTSPHKGFVTEENSTRAQDEGVKEPAGDGGQTQLQKCTFTPQQKSNGAASWEDFTKTNVAPKEETPCFAADKISTGTSLTTEMSSPTEKTAELMAASVSHGDKEEEEKTSSRVTANNAVNEPSGEFSQNNEALSVPDAAACQVSSISAVSEEINKQSPSCVGTEDPVSAQDSAEGLKNHDESLGPEPAGLNHSSEERGTANSVGVTETTALADASESSKSDQSVKPDPESSAPNPKEVALLENIEQKTEEDVKEQDKDGDVPKVKKKDEEEEEEEGEEAEEEEKTPSVSDAQDEKDVEVQEETGGEEQQQQQQQQQQQLSGSEAAEVEVKDTAATEKKDDAAEDDLGNSEEDLYRGAEELSGSQSNDTEPSSLSETSLLKVEDRCSLSPAVDILSYSEREWKGNTAKSALIRKGYKDMSQRFGSVRRVRGDNYCALRATLFQVLSHSPRLPAWLREEDDAVATLLKQLEDEDGLISQWTFPGSCLQGDGTRDVSQQLKSYMELLRNKWQEAVECPSAIERQLLCERTFRGSEEELGLLEALKLLMLIRAVELHGRMKAGDDVPLFCWLLFARDSSDCPRSFLSNHLSHVGLSAGLEQVEMFLLGYALQCTIQVYRLYKADTEEFVTFYPDDHKDEWPSVCLVTEDDRHYNVPVGDAAEPREEPSSS